MYYMYLEEKRFFNISKLVFVFTISKVNKGSLSTEVDPDFGKGGGALFIDLLIHQFFFNGY